MPQCSHDEEVKPIPKVSSGLLTPPTSALPTNHKILAPLLPANNDASLLASEKPITPVYETKDYRCVAQCLQNKMQYDTCEKSCTTVKSENGTAIGTKSNVINITNDVPTTTMH
jgi:hypothetical protein